MWYAHVMQAFVQCIVVAGNCVKPNVMQAFVWYPSGEPGSGRNTPTAWFKGGPLPVDVHATNPNPLAVLYIKQKPTGK